MRIGLLGGSFNPIHNMHVQVIKYILNKKILDEVWILPCKKHAFDKKLESEKHRVDMIKLAIKGIKRAKICDIELRSKGKNYTYDTVKKLKKRYNHDFFFIVGSDILCNFNMWYKRVELMKEIQFIILKREDYPIKKIKGMRIYKIINDEFKDISSTEIRDLIRNKKSIKNLVPKTVERYIIKNNLYKS